jgi:hypothetical protein
MGPTVLSKLLSQLLVESPECEQLSSYQSQVYFSSVNGKLENKSDYFLSSEHSLGLCMLSKYSAIELHLSPQSV